MSQAIIRILACLSVGLFGADTTAAQSAQLLLQGRFEGAIDAQNGLGTLPLLFSWPASSVIVTFVSDSIHASLSALPATTTHSEYSRFVFYVDGKEQAVQSTTPNATSIDWTARRLGPGKI